MVTYLSYKEIVEKAKIIKNHVETKHELVGSHNWAYYMSKQILEPNKNVKVFKIDDSKTGYGDKINANIYKADYLKCAEKFVKYVEKNKRLSYTITGWKNLKIGLEDYTYMFAKILVYYDANKQLPNYNLINSNIFNKPTVKKYGHASKSGCDNRGQNNGYYCGCHSLQEVFRNLTGIVVPQSTIASVCGTTTDGTDHDGLNTCVAWFNKKYNKNLSVKWYNFSELGWNGIKKIVNSNNQDCVIHNLYRNQWGHYEVINKVYDDYCDVQNSLGDYCSNGCYCGYVEERYLSTFRSYINGISQKSVMVITNEG